MAKKLYTESNIQDIANAIRDKNGTSNTYTTAQMAGAIRAIPSGGTSSIVNGVIEAYKAASSTIDASTFVEFTNGEFGARKQVDTGTGYSCYGYSAVLLDSTHVFIAYKSTSTQLKGIVCTISGTSITKGTAVNIVTTASWTGDYRQPNLSATLISSDKVFIAYAGSNNTLHGIVCTISGTTITLGTDKTIISTSNYGNYLSAVALDSSRVFIAHKGGNYSYGIVCTVSGTTITAGTDTQLSTTSFSYNGQSAYLLGTDKVFMLFGASSSSATPQAAIISISNTSITVGTITQLSTTGTGVSGSNVAVLSNSSVLVILPRQTTIGQFYGIVCTISGTTITAGTTTELSSGELLSGKVALAVLSSQRVVGIGASRKSELLSFTISISGTTPSLESQVVREQRDTLSDRDNTLELTALAISSSKVFITYYYDSGLAGQIFSPYGETRAVEATTSIEGLTKTQATTSTAGDVWVLYQ